MILDKVKSNNWGGWKSADPFTYEKLKEYSKRMRFSQTKAEDLIWQGLSGKKLEGYKFRRQHIIGNYIADFVCLKENLIIEIDGLIHQLPENKESDQVRTEWLESLWIQSYKIYKR